MLSNMGFYILKGSFVSLIVLKRNMVCVCVRVHTHMFTYRYSHRLCIPIYVIHII